MKISIKLISISILILCPFLVLQNCDNIISSNDQEVKIDTIVIRDTITRIDTINVIDTIFARPMLSGVSTSVGKPTIDSTYCGNPCTNVILKDKVPGAIGYRLFCEIPNVGYFQSGLRFSIMYNKPLLQVYNSDIRKYLTYSGVIYFYAVGVDSSGLDGPVSDAFPMMFYP